MKSEDGKAGPDAVTMRQLAPTVRYEGLLLAETAGTLASFADVTADVLLLGGHEAARLHPARVRRARPDAAAQPRGPCSRGWTTAGPATPARPTGRASPPSSRRQIRSFFAQR